MQQQDVYKRQKYDTVGTERTFETYDNRQISVSGGNYGWVIDQEKEAEALYQEIINKNTQVRKPEYKRSGKMCIRDRL